MWKLQTAMLLLVGCGSVFGLDEVVTHDAAPGIDALAAGPWTQVTTGTAHACGIQLDGSLWCWGRNDVGQLGLGTGAADSTRPQRVAPLDTQSWRQVSARASTTCAIRADSTLWCWGKNERGNVGDGTQMARGEPVQITGAWRRVAAGASHTCAITDAGALFCWGENGRGQVGMGSTGGSTFTPRAVMSTMTWSTVDVGIEHTCALATSGIAWCWGAGSNGELGNGSSAYSTSQPALVGPDNFEALATGDQHTCAVRTRDRAALCWGQNRAGQLGDPSVSTSLNPAPVLDTTQDWRAIAAGESHTCATRSDGSLWCWGANTSGQAGEGPTTPYGPVPRQVLGGAAAWEQISGGEVSTCGIGADHNLWCWGVDTGGPSTSVPTPSQVAGEWTEVTSGSSTSCAIAADGSLACWGANNVGQVGDGTRVPKSAPVTIAGPSWRQVALGIQQACALDGNGQLWCWGNNFYGLGDNSTSRLVPTPISNKVWRAIALSNTVYGIEQASSLLWCWGAHYYSQCGYGDATPSATPRQVGTLTWSSITAGNGHACGVNSSGLACWGYNGNGQIGDGTSSYMVYRTTPYQLVIPTGISTAVPDSRSAFTCALTGQSVYCWGYNYSGEVGSGTSVYTEPTPRLLAGSWRAVSSGGSHACAIATDSTLWCWGANERGQLGDGKFLSRRTPTQVDASPVWDKVSAGSQHTCALRKDRSLWCWGGNDSGQLGLGVTPPNGTPRLILP